MVGEVNISLSTTDVIFARQPKIATIPWTKQITKVVFEGYQACPFRVRSYSSACFLQGV